MQELILNVGGNETRREKSGANGGLLVTMIPLPSGLIMARTFALAEMLHFTPQIATLSVRRLVYLVPQICTKRILVGLVLFLSSGYQG